MGPFRRASMPTGGDRRPGRGRFTGARDAAREALARSAEPQSRFRRAQPTYATREWLTGGMRAPDATWCHGVRIRGPPAVIAIVNSKWAASDPSCE
jgi:hypothetical protein